jgi:hypothetical protein
MTVVLLLLTLAWFGLAIAIRIAPFVGREGCVHTTTTPAIRYAAVSRKILARKLHMRA